MKILITLLLCTITLFSFAQSTQFTDSITTTTDSTFACKIKGVYDTDFIEYKTPDKPKSQTIKYILTARYYYQGKWKFAMQSQPVQPQSTNAIATSNQDYLLNKAYNQGIGGATCFLIGSIAFIANSAIKPPNPITTSYYNQIKTINYLGYGLFLIGSISEISAFANLKNAHNLNQKTSAAIIINNNGVGLALKF